MNPRPGFWDINPDKFELLLALRDQGLHSCLEMSRMIGCTRNACIGKLSRMGLPSLFKGRGCKPLGYIEPPRQKPLHKPTLATIKPHVRADGNNNLSAPKMPKTDIRLQRPPQGKGKLISKCSDRMCKFSTGFDKKGRYLFCAATTDGGSWCPEHLARVFKRGAE